MESKKNILITGCDCGLGKEFAHLLANDGQMVIAGFKDLLSEDDLDQWKGDLTSKNNIVCVNLDITDESDIARLSKLIAGYGGLDMLVNNAGVNLEKTFQDKGMFPRPIAKIKEVFDVNFFGAVLVTQAMWPYLMESEKPVILNLSSGHGTTEFLKSGFIWGYSSSKAALNMFTHCLAKESDKLLAVAISPGWVSTQMGGESAPVTPKDAAKNVLHIVSNLKLEDSGKYLPHTHACEFTAS